jgi:cytochrome b pre-mRNA-processing protein 3
MDAQIKRETQSPVQAILWRSAFKGRIRAGVLSLNKEEGMFSWLFRSKKGPEVGPLLADLVASAREPEPFRDLGVADTFQGRFEYLALVSSLVLARLSALGEAGTAVAQELVDAIFDHLDDALRCSGVSDIGVGKKVKKMARSFYGRVEAYRAAMAAPEADLALREALARNLYGGSLSPEAVPQGLLARLEALREALEAASLPQLQAGGTLVATSLHTNP